MLYDILVPFEGLVRYQIEAECETYAITAVQNGELNHFSYPSWREDADINNWTIEPAPVQRMICTRCGACACEECWRNGECLHCLSKIRIPFDNSEV